MKTSKHYASEPHCSHGLLRKRIRRIRIRSPNGATGVQNPRRLSLHDGRQIAAKDAAARTELRSSVIESFEKDLQLTRAAKLLGVEMSDRVLTEIGYFVD